MQQIRIFKGIESEIAALESEVNRWLAESGARVVNMFGNIAPQTLSPEPSKGLTKSSFAPSDILLVILYETE